MNLLRKLPSMPNTILNLALTTHLAKPIPQIILKLTHILVPIRVNLNSNPVLLIMTKLTLISNPLNQLLTSLLLIPYLPRPTNSSSFKLSLIPLLTISIKKHSKPIHLSILIISLISTFDSFDYLHKLSILNLMVRGLPNPRLSAHSLTCKLKVIISHSINSDALKRPGLLHFSSLLCSIIIKLVVSLRSLLQIPKAILSANRPFRGTGSLFNSQTIKSLHRLIISDLGSFDSDTSLGPMLSPCVSLDDSGLHETLVNGSSISKIIVLKLSTSDLRISGLDSLEYYSWRLLSLLSIP